MATYAIGDLQGCFTELEKLLTKIKFDPNHDEVWFVGDLVNRGPQSLESIQFVRQLGTSAKCVLGNHDVHLIACYVGAQTCKPTSSLQQILTHIEADKIINWLREQPLMYVDSKLDWIMVHAGLLPQWDLSTAQDCAQQVENLLRSDNYAEFLIQAYGDEPKQWQSELNDIDRWRLILNAFTRIRMCDHEGNIDLDYKGPLGKQPKHLYAWFDVPRKSQDLKIIFGHWSALGLKNKNNLLALDTGCLWGNQLTAARIDVEPVEIYQIDCIAKKNISNYAKKS